MDGWLIALIVIAIIIIIVLIVLAIYASPIVINENKVVKKEISDNSNNSQKQHTANLTIAFINFANQTSCFLQQAKCGFKGVGETYDDMNVLAKYIGHNLHMINSCDHGLDLALLLCEKNELYKELTEEVLVNKKVIKGNDRLLRQLNEKNLDIADILFNICSKNEKKKYVTLLHNYDVAVVSQMGALTENNYKRYLASSREAQKLCITIAMILSYCDTKLS